MTNRDVSPDETLLKQIFPDRRPENISIFLQNWDKCVFKAGFLKDAQDQDCSACVVRLEAVNNEEDISFTAIAAMQQIAAFIIPEFVPQTYQVGNAKNAQGREFHFSMIEFVEGELLEDVWEKMSTAEQRYVVVELVEALEKLHSISPRDKRVKEVLSMFCEEDDVFLKMFERPGVFGGPHTGFLSDGSALLDSVMERKKFNKQFCTMDPIAESRDIRIKSNYEELGSLTVSHCDMDQWPGEAVLCHNDLTPRNLILQSHVSSDGETRYKLACIIDWELAGFYPASYELSLQDEYLGGGNRHASFYLLFQEHMKDIVPRSSSQVVLLQAMELIYESQQKFFLDGTNIPAHIRKRFLEKCRLVRDSDPYVGWTREPKNGPFVEHSSADLQKLEDDVVEKMLAKRKAKAKAC